MGLQEVRKQRAQDGDSGSWLAEVKENNSPGTNRRGLPAHP